MSEKPVQNEISPESPEKPKIFEEAQFFHNGFIAGLTAYARESGHPTLKSDNETLRRLMDEQGWKTIEEFERISAETRQQ